MPWKETCPMKERLRFVIEQESGDWTMAELCRRFGISRTTGYKWVERFGTQGPPGLQNWPRAPRHHPNAVSAEAEAAILRGAVPGTRQFRGHDT